MLVIPIGQTDVAKLMSASAGHVIAAFGTFNEDMATRAPFPVFKILLEIGVTRAFMLRKLTFFTKLNLATRALEVAFHHVDDPLAILCRT